LPDRPTARPPSDSLWKKLSPHEGKTMDNDEMITILEEPIRDPDTNPTAKCTAIRTLRQIQGEDEPDELDRELDRLLESDKP
jgi:hypothetical protein